MKHLLTTYWIEFGDMLNCQYGVTAFTLEDALTLIKEKAYPRETLPPVLRYKENIKYSDLDPNHVACNMGPMTERCIWFPDVYTNY